MIHPERHCTHDRVTESLVPGMKFIMAGTDPVLEQGDHIGIGIGAERVVLYGFPDPPDQVILQGDHLLSLKCLGDRPAAAGRSLKSHSTLPSVRTVPSRYLRASSS